MGDRQGDHSGFKVFALKTVSQPAGWKYNIALFPFSSNNAITGLRERERERGGMGEYNIYRFEKFEAKRNFTLKTHAEHQRAQNHSGPDSFDQCCHSRVGGGARIEQIHFEMF